MYVICCFCFKQKTAYEMRISDWSSDVCSSDLSGPSSASRLSNARSDGPTRTISRMVVSNVRLGLYFPGGFCAARNALSTNGLTMRISSGRAGGVGNSNGTSPLDQRSASYLNPAGARHAHLPMTETERKSTHMKT